MVYAVQRYAASRPWAKRIGQLYAQAAQPSAARKEMKEVIKRELERAAQVFEVRQQTIVAELALAESWGYFARHGRVISHLDDALAQALAHTRLPSHLPDTLILPADAFFLHVPAGGGAFVVHQPERKVLLLTLVGADFSLEAAQWLQGSDGVEALAVSYPGELAPQIAAVAERWQPLLASVLNGLAMMTQPKLELELAWQAGAPQQWVEQAAAPSCVKTRQRGRSQLLKAGFSEVSYCRITELGAAEAYATQGYWRRQAFGEAKANSRLVWVAPK
ncbi:hypothetical protein VI26_13440 [Chromobacterium sp. LK1]|uniref:hypothetical protein n=1 Tax=Chromobacterium sp. LK1 TaxID=1628193 RepID=UPI0006537FA0|nr:hypothetical protein [Chromobacterium sp. LK1]KMN34925.1 hypothetical protein VI26_13440 [Chromobacterium sp. LK1]